MPIVKTMREAIEDAVLTLPIGAVFTPPELRLTDRNRRPIGEATIRYHLAELKCCQKVNGKAEWRRVKMETRH